MKKLLYSGLTALLMLFAFMGLSTAQTTVSFSPASGSAVPKDQVIEITVNPSMAPGDVWYKMYSNLAEAQSKAHDDFDYTRGISSLENTQYLKVTDDYKAVAVAIYDWDASDPVIILGYAEYTLASSGPSVTFSPASGSEVPKDQVIEITVTPSMAPGDVWYKMYSNLAEAQSKAHDDFDYTRGISSLENTQYLKVTDDYKAVAVAIYDWDASDPVIILGYAEYTLAGGETPEPTPVATLTFDPASGSEVPSGQIIGISKPSDIDGNIYFRLYATLEDAKADDASWDAITNSNLKRYFNSQKPAIQENQLVIRANTWLLDLDNDANSKWDVPSYAVYTLAATVEPDPVPEFTLAFSPDGTSNVQNEEPITITATPELDIAKYGIYWQVYASIEEANGATWQEGVSPFVPNVEMYNTQVLPKITTAKPVLRAAVLDKTSKTWIASSLTVKEYTIAQREAFVISFDPEAGEVEVNTSVTLSVAPALTAGFELYYKFYETVTSAESDTWLDLMWESSLIKYTETAKPVITEAKPVLKTAVWNTTTSQWESTTVAEYSIAQEKPEITFTFKPASGTRVNENDTVKIECSSENYEIYFMMFDTKANAEAISDADWQDGMIQYGEPIEDEEGLGYPVITKAKPVIKAGYADVDEEENVTWNFFYAEYTVKDGNTPEPTKATVKLVVNGEDCAITNSHLYQLLLDNTHNMVGTYAEELKKSPVDESILPRIYGAASSTIPSGLSADNLAVGLDLDEEASIEVEPGVYDIFLLQYYDATGWLDKDIIRSVAVKGGYDPFYVDDVTLQAGLTYTLMVTFDKSGAHGEMVLPIDLKLDAVLGESKPSCELEEMEVSLAISNIGSIDVDQYEVLYIVEKDSQKDTTRETVNTPLAAGQSTVFTFSKKCALNAGKTTAIKAMVLVPGETNAEDNIASYTAFRAESAALPAQIKTTEMHMVKESDWTLDENGALAASKNASTPVFSTCFHFDKAGTYRLEYGYICGRYVELPDGDILVNNIDKYKIRLGKSSENWQEWPVVVFDSAITGSSNYNEFTAKEVFFEITEAGDYAFCIVPVVANEDDNLKFRNMQVTSVKEFDARFDALSVRAPRVIPQDWSNATHKLDVTVANRGLNKLENANIVILVNGNQAATQAVTLDVNEKQTLTVDVPGSSVQAGENLTFSGKIVRNEEVLSESDDLKAEVLVSETTAAFDYLTDNDLASIGVDGLSSYAGARIGLIYPVVKTDTLTAIACGWLEMDENTEIGIAIQRISKEDGEFVLGDMIYQTQVRRGQTGGLTTYDIPAFLLTPGDYFVSVEQIGRTGFALAMDKHPEGGFYSYDTYNQKWNYRTEAGYPAIRAVFGSNGTLRTNDALIAAISKPIAGGIFANNEPIVVSVRNNGIEKAEIPVYVKVDNTVLESKTVEVASYATVDVTFNADLAATNADRNILITAFTALSNDENLSNDTLTKKVVSFVPADPYRMDFESCLDFATEGFNPAWTSYSFDESPVLPLRHVLEAEFHYVDFPGSETDLGFIAFNPLATEPSMLFYEYYNNCRPHSGQRFGASLAISNADISKDDWLVSPKLKMPAANTQLSMWVRSFKSLRESYEIWVSQGSGDPMDLDFVRVYPEDDYDELKAPTEKWENVVFDLSQYNGKDVHVAIRCMSPDAQMFMIDDIVIGENVSNEQAQSADFRLSVYPNPVGELMSILSPDALIKEVSIFNLSGTLMHHSAGLSTENYRYNASGLVSGMYFVRVTTDKGTAVRKFTVR